MIFAMMFLSLIVLMGGALDLSKHRSESVLIQAALDATALGIIQETDLADAEVPQLAREFFDLNSKGIVANIQNFSAVRANNMVSVQVEADVNTFFMGLVGIETLPIFVKVESLAAGNTREIALVLDTTSSMSGSRLEDLKSATNLLLDRLEEGSPVITGNFRVGIVPFNEFVRVNPSDFPDAWLDDEGRSAPALEIFNEEVDILELFDHLGEDWEGCLRSRSGDLAYTDTGIITGDPDTRFLPLFAYDEADDGSYLNNYITDTVTHPDGISSVSSLLKYGITPGDGATPSLWSPVSHTIGGNFGPNRNCTSEPIKPLTTDFATIRNTVDNLTAEGDTQLTEGLIWGQRILSNRAPYTDALPINTEGNEKVLILLSDGINSIDGGNADLRSALNTHGYAGIGEQATLLPPAPVEDDINDFLDDEFAEACEHIKEEGTQLIVIRLELNDPDSLDLLRNCASGAENFFDATDSSQLEGIFTELAERVTSPRLTR